MPQVFSSVLRCAGQCLKLSPNLRRLDKAVKAALLNKDNKKAGEMEIKKLAQVSCRNTALSDEVTLVL